MNHIVKLGLYVGVFFFCGGVYMLVLTNQSAFNIATSRKTTIKPTVEVWVEDGNDTRARRF